MRHRGHAEHLLAVLECGHQPAHVVSAIDRLLVLASRDMAAPAAAAISVLRRHNRQARAPDAQPRLVAVLGMVAPILHGRARFFAGEMSKPALKALPAPVMISARTLSSRSH